MAVARWGCHAAGAASRLPRDGSYLRFPCGQQVQPADPAVPPHRHGHALLCSRLQAPQQQVAHACSMQIAPCQLGYSCGLGTTRLLPAMASVMALMLLMQVNSAQSSDAVDAGEFCAVVRAVQGAMDTTRCVGCVLPRSRCGSHWPVCPATRMCGTHKSSKFLRRPGIEPGSHAWKAGMITITLTAQSARCRPDILRSIQLPKLFFWAGSAPPYIGRSRRSLWWLRCVLQACLRSEE